MKFRGAFPYPVQDRIIARCKMNPELSKINCFTSEITNIEYRINCPTRILTGNHILNAMPNKTPSNES